MPGYNRSFQYGVRHGEITLILCAVKVHSAVDWTFLIFNCWWIVEWLITNNDGISAPHIATTFKISISHVISERSSIITNRVHNDILHTIPNHTSAFCFKESNVAIIIELWIYSWYIWIYRDIYCNYIISYISRLSFHCQFLQLLENQCNFSNYRPQQYAHVITENCLPPSWWVNNRYHRL